MMSRDVQVQSGTWRRDEAEHVTIESETEFFTRLAVAQAPQAFYYRLMFTWNQHPGWLIKYLGSKAYPLYLTRMENNQILERSPECSLVELNWFDLPDLGYVGLDSYWSAPIWRWSLTYLYLSSNIGCSRVSAVCGLALVPNFCISGITSCNCSTKKSCFVHIHISPKFAFFCFIQIGIWLAFLISPTSSFTETLWRHDLNVKLTESDRSTWSCPL